MDVKDLMVGDWIEDGYKKAQVTSITCDGIVETTAAISNIEVVEPIPLTEEILMKISDFTVRGEYVISGENRFPYARIAWSRDKEKFYFSTLGSNCYLDYVHQLQHLLRLCGIEKEIEL